MQVSNCCGAVFGPPGWPECDLCSCCHEHADVVEQDKPSIEILDMPEYDHQAYRSSVITTLIQKYGGRDNAIFELEAKVASLKVEADSLREMIDWEDEE